MGKYKMKDRAAGRKYCGPQWLWVENYHGAQPISTKKCSCRYTGMAMIAHSAMKFHLLGSYAKIRIILCRYCSSEQLA